MNTLKWLENWYSENCDGDWEHCKSVSIVILDNPGWAVDIFLEGTWLEDKDFQILDIERTNADWVYCSVSDNIFITYYFPKVVYNKTATNLNLEYDSKIFNYLQLTK